MLSPTEKRFIEYWKDQRTGGMWKYIILYAIVWTFIGILLLFALSILNFFYLDVTGFIPSVSGILIISILGSLYFWQKNEKRMRMLEEREGVK